MSNLWLSCFTLDDIPYRSTHTWEPCALQKLDTNQMSINNCIYNVLLYNNENKHSMAKETRPKSAYFWFLFIKFITRQNYSMVFKDAYLSSKTNRKSKGVMAIKVNNYLSGKERGLWLKKCSGKLLSFFQYSISWPQKSFSKLTW